MELETKIVTVMESLTPIPSQTRVEAYVFEIDGEFFHLAVYQAFRISEAAVWTANKKGKRISKDSIFKIHTKDAKKCLAEFIKSRESLEISE
jgi:hypothetical protein